MLDWSDAAVAIKALLYTSCLVAAGGVLFLSTFVRMLEARENARIVGFVRGAAVVGLFVIVARTLILSGMLGDDFRAMWDWSVIQIVLDSSEGTAAAARAVGLVVIAAL